MVSQFLLHHVFTLLLFLFLFFLLPVANSDLAADRAALVGLSSFVRGRTRRWNQSDPTPCSWDGVYCDNTTGRVTELRLPGRALSGEIPPNTIGNLTQLRTLSLRRNNLSGSIPSDLSLCTELQDLFLQDNKFSGEIPPVLFVLNNLVNLILARNNFSGNISPEFNNLTKLRILYLENNALTGSIPELNNLSGSGLRQFNVSYNKLSGSIPSSLNRFSSDSFRNNSLCGSPLGACPSDGNGGNKLSAGAISGIVIGSVIGFILILVILFILWRKHSSQTTPQQAEMSPSPLQSPVKPPDFEFRSARPILVRENSGLGNGDSGRVTATAARTGSVNVAQSDGLVFLGDGAVVFSLEELLRASAEVLGRGPFGSTYKAYLEGEKEFVVKRLKNVVHEREFREKVEGLGELVHENLVPLKAYYYGREEKLLVYDSIPMGSLSAILHGNRGVDRAALTWEIRTKIAIGAASGIDYLHSSGPKISHGNIKSSNILLTEYFDACVTEYGIAQLVLSTSTLELNGYRAPEVTDTRKISQKADVYSFGVLLLELLTAKDPNPSNEDGVELPRWVQSVVQEKGTIEVLDPELLRNQNREEEMVQLLHLGIYCTSPHPDRRPMMAEVARRIEEICESR